MVNLHFYTSIIMPKADWDNGTQPTRCHAHQRFVGAREISITHAGVLTQLRWMAQAAWRFVACVAR